MGFQFWSQSGFTSFMTDLPNKSKNKTRVIIFWSQVSIPFFFFFFFYPSPSSWFIQMNPTAEWHWVIVCVHCRYKFAIVCVYLVSLLEELMEHFMLFWLPLENINSAGGRGRGFTRCSEDGYFKKLFSWKGKMIASVTPGRRLWSSQSFYLIWFVSLERKMSEPKKHSFNFRKWGPLAFLPYLSLFFWPHSHLLLNQPVQHPCLCSGAMCFGVMISVSEHPSSVSQDSASLQVLLELKGSGAVDTLSLAARKCWHVPPHCPHKTSAEVTCSQPGVKCLEQGSADFDLVEKI